MSFSNTSLNTFANCMAKYENAYVKCVEVERKSDPNLEFGVMAHDVLYRAGRLRDDVNDNIETEYQQVIPSEILYGELKEHFKIKSWNTYFVDVVKQVAEYENTLIKEQQEEFGDVSVHRELKLCATVEDLKRAGYRSEDSVVGIIDLLILSKNSATIIDYKFSSTKKTQEDFDMNSQLPLYAFLVHNAYGVPIENIRVGYIDIPKKSFDEPEILSTGKISRSKSQNCSQEMYRLAVERLHGKDEIYNCNEGGYYYDCYCGLAFNKTAYLTVQWLDKQTYVGILNDLFDAAYLIGYMKKNNLPFLKKYDSYSCTKCEFLQVCKPWIYKNEGFQT